MTDWATLAPLPTLPLPAGAAGSTWENREMVTIPAGLRTDRFQAALIVVLVVLLAVFTWLIPPHIEWLHNILHHMNILPFMLAGLFFGWRGALRTVLLAGVLQAPSIVRHWHGAPLDAQDQVIELSTFGTAGLIAGVLADRERMQRRRVEATKQQLETMHRELQQNVEQLRRSERLTAAGELSASLAHEIRNPLASISGAAGILARGQASLQNQAECLEILTVESQRLNKLLTNFLNFARPRLPRIQETDAGDLLHSVTILAQHVAADRAVRLIADADAAALHCDPEQIKQLLLNLLLNALQASPQGGTVLLQGRVVPGAYRMLVKDEGEGFASEAKERMFEPFFTTKANGTGLGLAIAATIATQHGASLICVPQSPRGTCFVLEMPHAIADTTARARLAGAQQ
jgi:two-component system, NtrC family, sensor histidine kinase HydH